MNERRDAFLSELFANARDDLPAEHFIESLRAQLGLEEQKRRRTMYAAVAVALAVAAFAAPVVLEISADFGALLAGGMPKFNAVLESPISWVVLGIPALWFTRRNALS